MVEKRSSETIKIARVLCILCVVYPHFPPYGELSENLSLFEIITWEIGWILGRTSVPVLSVISGFLLVFSLNRRSYRSTLEGKLSTLLIPLIVWNFISVSIAIAMSRFTEIPQLTEWPNLLLGIYDVPHMTPLYFLRDILVCVLLFPIVNWALKRSAWITLVVLLVNACLNLDRALLINSSILLFFAFGCVLAKRKRGLVPPGYGNFLAMVSTALVLAASVNYPIFNRFFGHPWPTEGNLPESLYVLNRICGAYLFWSGAVFLTSFPIKRFILRFEPIIFFVFCIHPLLVAVVWRVAQVMGAHVGNFGHLLVFVFSPVLILGLSCVISYVAAIVSPRLLAFVLGGRAPSAHTMKSVLVPAKEDSIGEEVGQAPPQ